MRYVIQCPKCKRPADVDKDKSKPGYKVYEKNCNDCGTEVKPMIS